MSDLEEELGEGSPKAGEYAHPPVELVIQDKKLSFEEASKCLSNLGKDETGMRYAYLKMSPIDRKLTDLNIILNFRHLLSVDVSGNYLNLSGLQVLTDLPFLIQLLAQRNFVEGANLAPMPYLQDLSLSRNQITQTREIIQPQLEYLDLNYNQIYEAFFNPEDLPVLIELELRGNYLYECGGNLPISLEKLYLAENRISKIIPDDMAPLRNLKVLHLRNNLIRKLNGFTEDLINLEYLNLRQNKLGKIRQLRKLTCLPNLRTLIILQNDAWGDTGEKAGGEEEIEGEEEVEGEGMDAVDPKRITDYGYGNNGAYVKHTQTLIDNDRYKLDGTAYANKNFHERTPLVTGAMLDLDHKPTQSELNVKVENARGLGTQVSTAGQYNFFQTPDRRGKIGAYAEYSRHYNSPFGTLRPQYGYGIRGSYAF